MDERKEFGQNYAIDSALQSRIDAAALFNEKNAHEPLARLAATMEATNKTRDYIVIRIGAGDESGHFFLLQMDKSSAGTWDVTLYNPINYQDENNQDIVVLRHRLISAGFKIQEKICCRSLYLQAKDHGCGLTTFKNLEALLTQEVIQPNTRLLWEQSQLIRATHKLTMLFIVKNDPNLVAFEELLLSTRNIPPQEVPKIELQLGHFTYRADAPELRLNKIRCSYSTLYRFQDLAALDEALKEQGTLSSKELKAIKAHAKKIIANQLANFDDPAAKIAFLTTACTSSLVNCHQKKYSLPSLFGRSTRTRQNIENLKLKLEDELTQNRFKI